MEHEKNMMKKILITVLAVLTVLSLPVRARAAETPPSETTLPVEESIPPETTQPVETEPVILPTELTIETAHRYDGMEQAYCDGYIPTCKNGSVRIVLPLRCSGALYGDQLTASLAPDSGAFVAANYEKIFPLQTIPLEETSVDVFLVDFTLELSENRQNGTYPITVNADAYDVMGNAVGFSHTIFVTISDVPPETEPPVTEPEKPTAEPVVYISKCVTVPETVVAGEEFALTLTLKNSVTTKSVQNLMVTVDTGSLQIALLEDSNVFPIDHIPAGGEAELTIHCRSEGDIPAGKYPMQLRFSYDSSKVLGLSSSGSAIVEITQPCRMELIASRFPESVTVAETVPLPLQVMNIGRDTVYNVRCTVSGIGLSPDSTGYIGTMAPGTSAQTEIGLYIMALNTAVGNENGSPYGPTAGVVTLLFEDSSGVEHQQELRFRTTVNRSPILLQTELPVEEQEREAFTQWWSVILILGGVGIACLVGTILLRRKRGVSA